MRGYAASLKFWKLKKIAYTNHHNARKLASGAAPKQKNLNTKKK